METAFTLLLLTGFWWLDEGLGKCRSLKYCVEIIQCGDIKILCLRHNGKLNHLPLLVAIRHVNFLSPGMGFHHLPENYS
jgi:hypothetical protein